MKISKLIASLKSVTDDYPDAEAELGYCSCCIYIWIRGNKVAALNIDTDEFEYLQPVPPIPGLKELWDKEHETSQR